MSIRRLTAITSHLSPLKTTAIHVNHPHSIKLGSLLSTSAPSDMSAVKQNVDDLIAKNAVVVFSKSWCGVSEALSLKLLFGDDTPICHTRMLAEFANILQFCASAKRLLQQETKDMTVLEYVYSRYYKRSVADWIP